MGCASGAYIATGSVKQQYIHIEEVGTSDLVFPLYFFKNTVTENWSADSLEQIYFLWWYSCACASDSKNYFENINRRHAQKLDSMLMVVDINLTKKSFKMDYITGLS